MKKIDIEYWDAIDEDKKKIKESLLNVLNIMLMSKKPEDMLRGYKNFTQTMHVMNALNKAETTGVLELEDADYTFLREMMEKDVPHVWAGNPNIAKAIVKFMDAKEAK